MPSWARAFPAPWGAPMVTVWRAPTPGRSSIGRWPARGPAPNLKLSGKAGSGTPSLCRPLPSRVQRLDDLAQRLNEVAALIGFQGGQDALVDARGHRLDGAKRRLPLGGQAHGIHARVAAGALAVQQSLFHEAAYDVGKRGAVDPRLFDQPRLRDVRVVSDAGKYGILARR